MCCWLKVWISYLISQRHPRPPTHTHSSSYCALTLWLWSYLKAVKFRSMHYFPLSKKFSLIKPVCFSDPWGAPYWRGRPQTQILWSSKSHHENLDPLTLHVFFFFNPEGLGQTNFKCSECKTSGARTEKRLPRVPGERRKQPEGPFTCVWEQYRDFSSRLPTAAPKRSTENAVI